ncbi:type II toxin-antitoxin system RelE/ParE family toxin [Aequorivita marina]|uniref:type II toxin-antitoxin system RelE/ParE family toxin n=1 Tax=Aequorivita marina TaxID=3073654 RepID=UPI002876BE13|nr:type II toxin-antitoxin system RelE/ParE family toxin [Aequorivita sp. S2608]MDS1297848.1 type II toxin-antitoxin system RelE/ParE family toxin [Aequorivita sp. S2608]
MKSGYKILWTEHALDELSATYEYLELHFTKRELKKLSTELDRTLYLISQNPYLFPISDLKGARRVVIKKFNTLYYREKESYIEILSFFSNRQNPDKRKI